MEEEWSEGGRRAAGGGRREEDGVDEYERMKASMKDSMGLRLLHMVTSISTRTPNVVFTHAQHILRIVTNVTKALPPSSTSSPLFPLTLSQSLIYANTQTHTNTPHLVAASPSQRQLAGALQAWHRDPEQERRRDASLSA